MKCPFDRESEAFASFRERNYRRLWLGQAVSVLGTWMQIPALTWLVPRLTGSTSALGLVLALQRLPVLLLGPYAGLIADRFDRRRLMIVMQALPCLQALLLALLTVTGLLRRGSSICSRRWSAAATRSSSPPTTCCSARSWAKRG